MNATTDSVVFNRRSGHATTETPAILVEVYRDIPQSLWVNVGTVPRLDTTESCTTRNQE
jgi:hypothetical protein